MLPFGLVPIFGVPALPFGNALLVVGFARNSVMATCCSTAVGTYTVNLLVVSVPLVELDWMLTV